MASSGSTECQEPNAEHQRDVSVQGTYVRTEYTNISFINKTRDIIAIDPRFSCPSSARDYYT